MFKDVIVPFFTKLIVGAATVLTVAAVLAMFVPVANAGTVYEDRVLPVANSYCPIKLRDGIFVNGNTIISITVERYYSTEEFRLYVTSGKDSFYIASTVNNKLSISELNAWAARLSDTVDKKCSR